MTIPFPIKAAVAAASAPVVASGVFTDDHVSLVAALAAGLAVVVGTTVGIVLWIQKQTSEGREASFAFIEEVQKDLKSEMAALHTKLDDVRYNGCARACIDPGHTHYRREA